ncbi:hypothetical protein BDR26DRAFT_859936 [Obelidium mucronatum]|nr:hypothetical protein BDR26DRAFT_859936 [Obelidium mucronatum]
MSVSFAESEHISTTSRAGSRDEEGRPTVSSRRGGGFRKTRPNSITEKDLQTLATESERQRARAVSEDFTNKPPRPTPGKQAEAGPPAANTTNLDKKSRKESSSWQPPSRIVSRKASSVMPDIQIQTATVIEGSNENVATPRTSYSKSNRDPDDYNKLQAKPDTRLKIPFPPDKSTNSFFSKGSIASRPGLHNHCREITETWTTIIFKMRWSLVGIVLNAGLIGVFRTMMQRLVIEMDKDLIHVYVGVLVEVVLLIANTITLWGLEEAGSCVFGYLLSSKTGFSLAACGYLQASPVGEVAFRPIPGFNKSVAKTPDTRLSFIWIITELQVVTTPFSAISIKGEPFAVYNDVSDCVYFVQDNKIKPDTEGGVSEYVFGSSLGIMRSEVPGVNLTTAMYPPQLISALNDGDTIQGLGFSADISSVCKCATALTSAALVAAGVAPSQVERTIQEYQKMNNEPGLTFGTLLVNDTVQISNVFSGYGLCGGKGANLVMPLVCSTTISNHQIMMLEIQFMTDGTTASIAPNIVRPLYSIGRADVKKWLFFGMNAITNGPVSSYLTPPTVPGSLAPMLWWTAPNLIGMDRAIVESGIETMYAILFKAAIQRTYTAEGTQCPRKNTIRTSQSEVYMEFNGYAVTAFSLTIQLIVSIVSTFSFILWFTAPSPIGPAVRATQESIYLITLIKTSERLGIGLYDLCNAETYYIWQKLDYVCRIGESITTIEEEIGKITIDKASLVRPLRNGKQYY